MLFKTNKQKLELIKELKIDLEKDLQKLTEQNLKQVFGLKFIASEFQLNNLRIDTLAFDEESKSFIIIEYKRDRNISIIDQGYAYLSLLINNKADFILHYNETQKNTLKKGDVDWSQTRVIFIARSYTAHQKQAINFNDMPIELWKVAKYENNLIEYDRIETPEISESIKTFSKSGGVVQKVSKEVKKYTTNDHFKKDWTKSRKLFEELREKILNLDINIKEKITKLYIAYEINNKNFSEINIHKSKLGIYLDLNIKDIKDPENRVRDCSKTGRWATGVSIFEIKITEDITYAIFLIKQVYNKFYK